MQRRDERFKLSPQRLIFFQLPQTAGLQISARQVGHLQ